MKSIEQYQNALLPILIRYDIKRAAIFGSVAKGYSRPASDIDILIEPKSGFTLFNMLNLEAEIERALDKKVDLVEFAAIKASIKNEVLQNAITIL